MTGLLIARGLGPSEYGIFTFLLGSFVAIRSLFDLGTSSAFYTFMAQRPRSKHFYFLYFAWLAAQFLVTVAFVLLLAPDGLVNKLWLGHERYIIALAFLATFMQQQLWVVAGQIAEAMRRTVLIQIANISAALIYLAIIGVLTIYGLLTTVSVLVVLVCLYATFATIIFWQLWSGVQTIKSNDDPIRGLLDAYGVYCRPLLFLYVISFAYDFLDKWLLQRFGGPSEQGYFQVSYQIAQISLLATTSILNIFWKEIAEALANSNLERVRYLYQKISRSLVMFGAMISGLLIPWSEQIVKYSLGDSYVSAWPVLAIMLLYPIHQSMGQIGTTVFLASGKTRLHMLLSTALLVAALPVTYFAVASTNATPISGFGLGAVGMASKLVLVNILSVNVQAWFIARSFRWTFDWIFQVLAIPGVLVLGYMAKFTTDRLCSIDYNKISGLVIGASVSSIVYVAAILAMMWFYPGLVGSDRAEFVKFVRRFWGHRPKVAL